MPTQNPTFPDGSIFHGVFADLSAAGVLVTDATDFAPATPNEVIITKVARTPSADPTLGVKVELPAQS